MPLLSNLDFDKLAYHTLSDLRSSIKGWLSGAPRDEPALMNRITSKLSRRRRGCDVGLNQRMDIDATTYELHRRGSDQTDRYGADFAVTVSVNGRAFLKTAIFQLKRCHRFNVELIRNQIEDAQIDNRFFQRSFTLAVDEDRATARIKSTKQLAATFPDDQESCTVSAESWDGLIRWLWRWLNCELGPHSKHGDPDAIEPLLEPYVIREQTWLGWETDEKISWPEEFVPVRAWLQLKFTSKEGKPSY